MGEPRLSIELVPETAFGDNLRSVLPEEAWDKLRYYVYRRENYCCEVCGRSAKGSDWPLHCHEEWEYDEENNIQKLTGLRALCPACHDVKHIGRTMRKGPREYDQAIKRLVDINDWSVNRAKDYAADQLGKWSTLSDHDWEQDLSLLEKGSYGRLLEDFDLEL